MSTRPKMGFIRATYVFHRLVNMAMAGVGLSQGAVLDLVRDPFGL